MTFEFKFITLMLAVLQFLKNCKTYSICNIHSTNALSSQSQEDEEPQSPTIISKCKSISSPKAFFLYCVDKFFYSFLLQIHISSQLSSLPHIRFIPHMHICLLTSYANVECQMSRYLHKKFFYFFHCCERQKYFFSHALYVNIFFCHQNKICATLDSYLISLMCIFHEFSCLNM